jgi:hypothetical protein
MTMLGEMGELPDIRSCAEPRQHPLGARSDLQPEPLPSAGGGSAATSDALDGIETEAAKLRASA